MINPYVIKKWGSLIVASLLPSFFFVLMMSSLGFLWAIIGMLVGALLAIMVGSMMLKNPFSDLLEGKGLLSLNLTSTGILQAFIMPFDKNFIRGYLNGEEVEDYFDRESTFLMNAPKKAASVVHKSENGDLLFKVSNKELQDSRFAFNQYPVLIYNSMSNSFFSKKQLGDFEKKIISYNKLIFLTKKVEDLTVSVKNFARHIVDTLKPKKNGGALPMWVMMIIIVVVIAFVVWMVISSGGAGAIGGAINAAGSSIPGAAGPVVPA